MSTRFCKNGSVRFFELQDWSGANLLTSEFAFPGNPLSFRLEQVSFVDESVVRRKQARIPPDQSS